MSPDFHEEEEGFWTDYRGNQEIYEARKERQRRIKQFQEVLQKHIPLRDLALDQPNWIVEGLLPEGYLMLLAGNVKAGKSDLSKAISLAVMKGEDFAGRKVRQGAVLWCNFEENWIEKRQSLRESEVWRNEELPLYETLPNMFKIDTEMGLECIDWTVQEHDIKLVVIDALYRATSGRNLREGHCAMRALAGLKAICDLHGCAMIVLHQLSPNGYSKIADSVQLEAASSISGILTHEQTAAGRIVRLTTKGRGEFANQTHHFYSPRQLAYEPYTPVDEPDLRPQRRYTAKELKVLDTLSEAPKRFGQLMQAIAEGKETTRYLINRLTQTGEIQVAFDETNHRLYALAISPEM